MKWARRGADSIQCGEWIISRARVQGSEMYTVWRGTEAVSRHDNPDAAKRAAQEQGR